MSGVKRGDGKSSEEVQSRREASSLSGSQRRRSFQRPRGGHGGKKERHLEKNAIPVVLDLMVSVFLVVCVSITQ